MLKISVVNVLSSERITPEIRNGRVQNIICITNDKKRITAYF